MYWPWGLRTRARLEQSRLQRTHTLALKAQGGADMAGEFMADSCGDTKSGGAVARRPEPAAMARRPRGVVRCAWGRGRLEDPRLARPVWLCVASPTATR